MNKSVAIPLGIAADVPLILNIITLRRGDAINCAHFPVPASEKAIAHGVPLIFYQTAREGKYCGISPDQNEDISTDRTIFTPALVWFTLLTARAILTGIYLVMGRKGSHA